MKGTDTLYPKAEFFRLLALGPYLFPFSHSFLRGADNLEEKAGELQKECEKSLWRQWFERERH